MTYAKPAAQTLSLTSERASCTPSTNPAPGGCIGVGVGGGGVYLCRPSIQEI